MAIRAITRRLRSACHLTLEALPPPQESKRTWTLINRELKFAKTHRLAAPLHGLATTVCVAAFSFFNGFFYLGRETVRTIKALKQPKVERNPFAFRPIISSFLLALTSLLYLAYSLGTLGIGPYYTNRRVANFLMFTDKIDRMVNWDLGPPLREKESEKKKPTHSETEMVSVTQFQDSSIWQWTEEDEECFSKRNARHPSPLVYQGL